MTMKIWMALVTDHPSTFPQGLRGIDPRRSDRRADAGKNSQNGAGSREKRERRERERRSRAGPVEREKPHHETSQQTGAAAQNSEQQTFDLELKDDVVRSRAHRSPKPDLLGARDHRCGQEVGNAEDRRQGGKQADEPDDAVERAASLAVLPESLDWRGDADRARRSVAV